MLRQLKTLLQKKRAKLSISGIFDYWETDFDDIWHIQNSNNLLVALNGFLWRKCQQGGLPALSAPERACFLVLQLEAEVNNGGFVQFFRNASGNFSGETAWALEEIGARKTADIYRGALTLLGGPLPQDILPREALLDSLLTPAVSAGLSQYDTQFYQYPDDLTALCHHHALKNRARFTR